MLVVDAHEDIAWSALTWGRDPRLSALETRLAEVSTDIPKQAGLCMVGLPEWLSGQVAVIFGTIFPLPSGHGSPDVASYTTAEEAHALGAAQLDYYHRLADESPQVRLIGSQGDLEDTLLTWKGDEPQVGIVPILEGADPIREPAEAEMWFERGLRGVGLAWRAGSRFAGGDGRPGRLTDIGSQLLEVMADLGLMLDVSHLAEESLREALDHFEGRMIASHSNPRARVEGPRQLSDKMIRRLAERDAVIGIVAFNPFLKNGWKKGDPRDGITAATVAGAIDHVCQVVGDDQHVGLGSDFDGGFGAESAPSGFDTIADLRLAGDALSEIGYGDEQIGAVLAGNWLRLLRDSLPE